VLEHARHPAYDFESPRRCGHAGSHEAGPAADRKIYALTRNGQRGFAEVFRTWGTKKAGTIGSLNGTQAVIRRERTMKGTQILFIGYGLFASVAFAQSQPATTGVLSAQDFVNKVAISDMFEIQSSQMALAKQADADTKPFAEKMIQDHQKTTSELKAVVEGSMVKLTLPASLDSEHQKMLDELNAKSGKDFDTSYDQIQAKAHRDAVALFEAYAKSGEDSELKAWAGKTLPSLKAHLTMAENLK
jgi:putative membrane protein